MKKIYLMRHAKAVQEGYEDDFNRSINDKGEAELVRLASRLKEREIKLDLIIASAATRTRQSAKKLAGLLNFDENHIRYENFLYEARAKECFEFLQNLDENVANVLLVGHNPTMRELCELLSQSVFSSFPTSSVLGLCFEVKNFKDIKAHSAKLLFFEKVK